MEEGSGEKAGEVAGTQVMKHLQGFVLIST